LPNQKVFRVISENLSEENGYIGKVSLNGKPLHRNFIRHEEIMNGGELRFLMTNAPNRVWAIDESTRPFSMSAASH